jgi:hypothetical protein
MTSSFHHGPIVVTPFDMMLPICDLPASPAGSKTSIDGNTEDISSHHCRQNPTPPEILDHIRRHLRLDDYEPVHGIVSPIELAKGRTVRTILERLGQLDQAYDTIVQHFEGMSSTSINLLIQDSKRPSVAKVLEINEQVFDRLYDVSRCVEGNGGYAKGEGIVDEMLLKLEIVLGIRNFHPNPSKL